MQGYSRKPGRDPGGADRRLAGHGRSRFVDGGELFVSGRAKDLVILRGVNHAPQEFEMRWTESTACARAARRR